MRVMMKVSIPTEAGNKGVTDGSLPKTFGEFMEKVKPEAAYFVAEDGNRTGILFFDLDGPVDIPSVAEPFFSNLNASISITPAMDAKDMQAGVQKAVAAG